MTVYVLSRIAVAAVLALAITVGTIVILWLAWTAL